MILVINLDTGDLIAPTFYETLSQNNKVMVSSTQPCQETDNLKFISDSDPYQAFCRMLSKVKPEEFKEPIIILLIGHGMIVNGHHNIVIEYPTKYQFLHTKDIFRIIDQSSIIYELVMISCHSGSAHADFDNPRATLYTTSSPYTPVQSFDLTHFNMPHINSGLEVIISLLSSRLIGDTQVTSEAEENTNVEAVAAAKETTIVQFKTIIPDDIRFTKGGICGRYMPCRLPDPGKNEEVAVVILEAIKSQQIVESKAIEGAVTTRTGSCIIEASKEDVISAIGLGPVETQWMEMLKFLLDGELRNRLVNGEKPEDLVMPTDIVPLTFTFDIYPHLIDPTKSDVFLNFISKHTQPEVSTELRFTVPNELLLRFFNREIGFEEILETIISIEKVDNLIRELDEGEVDEQGVNQKVDISTVLTNLGLYIEVLYNCIALSQEIPIQWHEVANGITSPEKHFNLPIEVIGDTST